MRKPRWAKTAPSATRSATCPHCRHAITIETIVHKQVADLFYRLENVKKPRPYPHASTRQREGAKIAQALIYSILKAGTQRTRRAEGTRRHKGKTSRRRKTRRGRSL